MRVISVFFAILYFAFLTWPANAQETPKWIVMGRDAASLAQSRLATRSSQSGQPAFAVLESNQDRVIAGVSGVGAEEFSRAMQPETHRCGGYTVHDTRELAIAEVNNPFYAANAALKVKFPKTIDQQAHVVPALGLVDKAEIIDIIAVLANLGTRYHDSQKGQDAALLLEARWRAYGAGRTDFSVERVVHAWKQNSVIATIKGSVQPDEVVIIGAHLDSINLNDNTMAPGADDDGTGIAVISEILRVLTKIDFKPQRTLQFMAYAAEEVGLKGSKEIAMRYVAEGRNVLAALQVDMAGFAGSDKHMFFVADQEYVNKDLTDYLRSLIGEYNGPGAHEITHGDTLCGYGCSDHVSWTRVGIPSAFPFETTFAEFNTAIHTPMDVVAKIDTTGAHQARFAKLGLEYMIEIGKSSK